MCVGGCRTGRTGRTGIATLLLQHCVYAAWQYPAYSLPERSVNRLQRALPASVNYRYLPLFPVQHRADLQACAPRQYIVCRYTPHTPGFVTLRRGKRAIVCVAAVGQVGLVGLVGLALPPYCCNIVCMPRGNTQRIACRSGASTGCSGLCPLPIHSHTFPYSPIICRAAHPASLHYAATSRRSHHDSISYAAFRRMRPASLHYAVASGR